MISSQMESLLLVVVGVFLVFSLFGSRRRFVLIYSLSAKELYLWLSMRLILMVLVLVILYFLFPQHRHLGQNIYLVYHSAYSIFRDFA